MERSPIDVIGFGTALLAIAVIFLGGGIATESTAGIVLGICQALVATFLFMVGIKERKDGLHWKSSQEIHRNTDQATSQPGTHSGQPSTYTSNPFAVAQQGTSQMSLLQGLGLQGLGFQGQLGLGFQGLGSQSGLGQLGYSTIAGLPFPLPTAQPPRFHIKNDGIKLGEIVAYRCWIIRNGFLYSTAAERAWAPDEIMKAGTHHLREGLGVFAYKEMSLVIQNFGAFIVGEGMAFGSIEIWGEIIEHELGYRAEFAKIRSIDFINDYHTLKPVDLNQLRVLYKVDNK